MSYYIYSHEPLPNPDLMGKAGYTPDSERIAHGGFSISYLPPNTWVKLPEREHTIRHRDWLDKKGTRETIYIEDLIPALRTKTEARGVIILDHEPTEEEKKKYGQQSAETNEAFRMKCVEWYENQVREKEVTGHGRTTPTPYENMCYETLGLTKPYSVEAMRAQRHPGEAVGEQIVAALDRLEKRRNDEAKAEKASHSKPAPVGA
jgi:hypothetical protein